MCSRIKCKGIWDLWTKMRLVTGVGNYLVSLSPRSLYWPSASSLCHGVQCACLMVPSRPTANTPRWPSQPDIELIEFFRSYTGSNTHYRLGINTRHILRWRFAWFFQQFATHKIYFSSLSLENFSLSSKYIIDPQYRNIWGDLNAPWWRRCWCRLDWVFWPLLFRQIRDLDAILAGR